MDYDFLKTVDIAREAMNIITHASNHVGKSLVIRIDLKDFFHSITFHHVRNAFKTPPFSFSDPLAILIAQLTTWNNRLPMGAPTSPVISSIVFREMDEQLLLLARDF